MAYIRPRRIPIPMQDLRNAKRFSVTTSLSVIVPVRNAQSTLTADVQRLLEMLPDVAQRFEVIVIDDGSADMTEEVAYDLTCRYPQVRARRNPHAMGQAIAIETGMQIATGEIVIIQQPGHPLSLEDIHCLWSMHNESMGSGPVTSPSRPMGGPLLDKELLHNLSQWGAQVHQLKKAEEAMAPIPKPHEPKIKAPRSAVQRRPNFLRRIQQFALGEG